MSTKSSFVKNYAIKKKDLSNSFFLKKHASVLEQANQSYRCLKLAVLQQSWALFVQFQQAPSGKSIQIRMVHCLSVNDYGLPKGSRRFHSPLHPDIYMDLDKKKIDEKGQPATVKSFLMWNVSAFGLLQLKRLNKRTPFQANKAKGMPHFSPNWSENHTPKGST